MSASSSGILRSVSPAIARESARSGPPSLSATNEAESIVPPERNTASRILNAARRAGTPSTLGIGSCDHHLAAMKRPKHVKAPAHLSPSPPVPAPRPLTSEQPPAGEESRLDPTRYSDWEKKGIAV